MYSSFMLLLQLLDSIRKDIRFTHLFDGCCLSGSLRLDTNRLNTSHSQRLNSGKPLGTGRCGWWYPIDPCPNEPLSCLSNPITGLVYIMHLIRVSDT